MTSRVLSRSAALGLVVFSALAGAQSHCPAPEVGFRQAPWGNVSAIVTEDFELGTLDRRYSNGFEWGKTWQSVRMSVVRDDQHVVWTKDGNTEGPVSGKNWEGFSGSHSMRFGFPQGQNGWAEQRFSIGGAYPELWIGYWLRVPDNWRHGTGVDSNNKFFAIWMDEYEKQGPTGVIQTRNMNGDSRISPYIRNRQNRHPGESPGGLFIDRERDRGRWMQVIIHVKMADSASAANGIFELYRRWEDEDSFDRAFSFKQWDNYHVGGNRGFAHGYLMGWANATQPTAHDWLLDDFIITQENLLEIESQRSAEQTGPTIKPVIPEIMAP